MYPFSGGLPRISIVKNIVHDLLTQEKYTCLHQSQTVRDLHRNRNLRQKKRDFESDQVSNIYVDQGWGCNSTIGPTLRGVYPHSSTQTFFFSFPVPTPSPSLSLFSHYSFFFQSPLFHSSNGSYVLFPSSSTCTSSLYGPSVDYGNNPLLVPDPLDPLYFRSIEFDSGLTGVTVYQ